MKERFPLDWYHLIHSVTVGFCDYDTKRIGNTHLDTHIDQLSS